jgi:hypothetical protein
MACSVTYVPFRILRGPFGLRSAIVISMVIAAVAWSPRIAVAIPPTEAIPFRDGALFDVSENGSVIGFNTGTVADTYRDVTTGTEFTVGQTTNMFTVKGDGRFVVEAFDRDHGGLGLDIRLTDRSAVPATTRNLDLKSALSPIGSVFEYLTASSDGEKVLAQTTDGVHHWLSVWHTRTGQVSRIGYGLPRTAQNWGSVNGEISADGTTVVFGHVNFNTGCRSFDARSCSFAIYTANADGTGTTLVTGDANGNLIPMAAFRRLVISGDGLVVAYVAQLVSRTDGVSQLFLKDLVTGETTIESSSVSAANYPVDTTDVYLDATGNRIAFREKVTLPGIETRPLRVIVFDRAEQRRTEAWPPALPANSDFLFEIKDFAMSLDGRTVVFTPYNRENDNYPLPSYIIKLPPSGGRIGAGGTVEILIAGVGGVPMDAAAVVLNVTAVGAGAAGYVTIWPCGERRPDSSNLNYPAREDTASLVISKIGANGKVCAFTSAPLNLVADVSGYFPNDAQFVGVNPIRKLDTRAVSRPAVGSVVEIPVTGGSVPGDAGAVVMTLTATGTGEDGFVTSWPCGEPRPEASSLNYRAGNDRANLVLAKVGRDGKVCLYASSPAHLLADVAGYFPAGAAFEPLTPSRLIDSRLLSPNGTREFGVSVPRGAKAVTVNLTVTRSANDGYATVWPCSEQRPATSNINFLANTDVANAVVVATGERSSVCVFMSSSSGAIVDLGGVFPAASTYAPVPPTRVFDSRRPSS